MATQTYKCPSCGAGIAFSPETQRFDCEFCLSSFTLQELTKFETDQAVRHQQKEEQKTEREQHAQKPEEVAEEQAHLSEYVCDSCGAHVVTDDTTAATFCYYCHNPVVLTERLSGAFRPDVVLPFTLSEETAKQKFLEWASGHRYVPKDFASDNQLEKMTGLYLPYWLNDAICKVNFAGTSRKIRTWTAGDYLYTETSLYTHERKGEIFFDDLPAIAFSKFDPDLLRAVTPFDMDQAENFSPAYLSGFFAEQFDMDQSDVTPILEEAARRYADKILNDGLQGHGAVSVSHKQLNPTLGEWVLALLPTWVLTYQYGGTTYVYAVNGQTGASYGELPLQKSRLLRDALLIGLATLVIVFLIAFFFWR